jgi:superfamily II DNA or RNA helicase
MILANVVDNKYIKIVSCNNDEYEQLSYSFRKRIKNWRFSPLVKKKIWDGYISFFNKKNELNIGLWNELLNVCKNFNYEIKIDGLDDFLRCDLSYDDFEKWVNEFFSDHPKFGINSDYKIRDYQIRAAYNVIKYKLSLTEIATGGGKTLIYFIVFAYLKSHGIINKMLIVVPNVSLIIQMHENFISYNNKKLQIKDAMIYADTEKEIKDANVVIGTFQSLTKQKASWFNDIDCICIDEAHYTNCTSIKSIISKCNNAKIKFGMSGTLERNEDCAEYLTLQAYIGPFVDRISADFLINNNYISNVFIKVIHLKYKDVDINKSFYELRKRKSDKLDGAKILSIEKQFIRDHRDRFLYICNMIEKTTKNTLVLFNDVKYKYGREIYDYLRNNINNRKIFYIDGSVGVKLRNYYFKTMENNNNVIIVASIGTLGEGVSINNIYNIFLVEGFKSDKIIRQSIGRGVRLKEGKDKLIFIDFIDDLSYGVHKNYLLKQGLERINIYQQEKFNFKIYDVDI